MRALLRLSPRAFALGVVLVSFAVRLAAVLALRDVSEGPAEGLGADPVEYNELAWQVATGHGYAYVQSGPTSFRAPGFPLYLGAIYRVLGRNYVAAYLSFCALGAVSCLFAYLVGRQLLSEFGGRAAAVLATFYLPHVYFATDFVSENLFAACLAAAVWCLIEYLQRGSVPLLAVAALALGWATLTRPFALLLYPVFGLVLLFGGRPRMPLRLAHGALFGVLALAVVLPWTYRNHRVHGKPVLVATNGGSTFYGGNNDQVASLSHFRDLGGWVSTVHLPGRDLIDAAPDEVSHDKVEWRLGVQWLKDNPSKLPQLLLFKFLRLWSPEGWESRNRKFAALMTAAHVPFFCLYLVGFVRCLRGRVYWTPPWMVVHGTFLATILTALIFWGAPRFRDANAPLLMLYAALALRAAAPQPTGQVQT